MAKPATKPKVEAPSAKSKSPFGDNRVSPDQLKSFYRDMLLIRRFEERAGQLYGMGLIGGFCHLYIGQEAIAVGMQAVKAPGDQIITAYRAHGHMLACGVDPKAVMAELTGRAPGVSKGKGGSMHLFDVEHGFYGGYGIVGGHLTLATGAAYALRFRGTDRIAVCYFGDGAMNIGSFHEAMNIAGLWGKEGNCPVVFVIENNGYAMGTSVERHSALTDLSARVQAYNIKTEKVDGQDVFAIRGAADRVVRQIRESGKPYCIEAVTYRFSGHGAADILQPYRSKDEVEQHRHRDPIVILKNRLAEICGTTDDDVKAMEQWATERVAEAVKFAEESPVPEPKELFSDVVAEHGPHPVNL